MDLDEFVNRYYELIRHSYRESVQDALNDLATRFSELNRLSSRVANWRNLFLDEFCKEHDMVYDYLLSEMMQESLIKNNLRERYLEVGSARFASGEQISAEEMDWLGPDFNRYKLENLDFSPLQISFQEDGVVLRNYLLTEYGDTEPMGSFASCFLNPREASYFRKDFPKGNKFDSYQEKLAAKRASISSQIMVLEQKMNEPSLIGQGVKLTPWFDLSYAPIFFSAQQFKTSFGIETELKLDIDLTDSLDLISRVYNPFQDNEEDIVALYKAQIEAATKTEYVLQSVYNQLKDRLEKFK
jgi:hypothetical protein